MRYRFVHNREARTRYRGSFAADLGDGQSISSPIVRVDRREGTEWIDRTTEILTANSPAVDGADGVTWEFKPAASATEKRVGMWRVVVKALRSDGELLVGEVDERPADADGGVVFRVVG